MIKLRAVYHRKKQPQKVFLKRELFFLPSTTRFSAPLVLEEPRRFLGRADQNTRLLFFCNRSIIIFKNQFSALVHL